MILEILACTATGFLLGWMSCGLLKNRTHNAELSDAYQQGIQEGHDMETAWAVKTAVEAERLANQRRLHDSGRRAMPRETAGNAVIHKVQVAPAPPRRRNKRS